jgi:hypothetical protein
MGSYDPSTAELAVTGESLPADLLQQQLEPIRYYCYKRLDVAL